MNSYEFKGPFKDIIPLYIKYKQSQGYECKSTIQQLHHLDKYFVDNGYMNQIITEEIAINYCKRKNEKESNNTIYKRQHIIRDLALFLKEYGYKDVYVYNYDYVKRESSFTQYIFSDNEIIRLFEYLDEKDIRADLKIQDLNFNQNCRMIIRLLYCCGLRKSEALYLKVENVDFSLGTILIKESKHYCTRRIPASQTVIKSLKSHIKMMKLDQNDYLFKKSNGKLYDKHFSDKFKLILKKINIASEFGNSPRLHDLRFTFAVKALEKMQNDGQDIYCTLPILSIYMGHKKVTSTEYYLKYTQTVRNQINDKMAQFNDEIFFKQGGEIYE